MAKHRSSPLSPTGINRRDFLMLTAAGAAMSWAGNGNAAEVPKKPQPGAPKESDIRLPLDGKMPMRPLGRTGVSVSLLGIGGFHLGLADSDEEATRIVRTAVDHGVNFLDNCWDYNDGKSHRRMGRALRDGYRKQVFLMTKIDGRTRAAATQQIEQSLRDLETDMIDLVQIHEVIRMSDPDRVFGPDGAIEALTAAQKAGKLRFIGFTGHKSAEIHLAMLDKARANGFRFDTVQMPLNVMDGHHDGFQKKVLPVAIEQQMGVLGMKPLGSGLFLRSTPVTSGELSPTDCLHYAMNLPTSVVITGCDTVGILDQGLNAALRFTPQSHAWMQRTLAKTAPAANAGWEKYKLTNVFDGTAKHPWWLESASLQK